MSDRKATSSFAPASRGFLKRHRNTGPAAPAAFALALGLAGALAALPPPAAAQAASESVLYSFAGGHDGRNPNEVVDLAGVLYGSTALGGAGDNGTVFRLDAPGEKTTLHYFHGTPDGALPLGGLVQSGQLLFGTTALGGTAGGGTIYSVNSSGARVIYSFPGGAAGSGPTGRLLNLQGVLYGATGYGGHAGGVCGTSGCGVIFSLTPAGVESVLYSFQGGSDGYGPGGDLIYANGTLYGVTLQGPGCSDGCGTVFGVTLSGQETTLHQFAGATDGNTPNRGLVKLGNSLFGTTQTGGKYNAGTVFRVGLDGSEKIIHDFAGGADGSFPAGGLVAVGTTLYGTTSSGGSSNDGTVFSITNVGVETVIYSFAGPPDAGAPNGYLIPAGSSLIGVSQFGGAKREGTVFSVTP